MPVVMYGAILFTMGYQPGNSSWIVDNVFKNCKLTASMREGLKGLGGI